MGPFRSRKAAAPLRETMPTKSASPADRLRAAREQLGLTQRDAARTLGVSFTSYAQYEQGVREPTLEWLIRFAETVGIDPHTLDPRLASNRTPKRSQV